MYFGMIFDATLPTEIGGRLIALFILVVVILPFKISRYDRDDIEEEEREECD